MFNYFVGKIIEHNNYKILKNDSFGVQINYSGSKRVGEFYLHPVLDVNHNTSYYLAFDDIEQMDIFYKLLKISGVGPKTSCFIATSYPLSSIKDAIQNADVKFFKSVPGIGPKTAKKIIIELKDKISLSDIDNFDRMESEKEVIISGIVGLGYPKEKVKNAIKDYEGNLSNTQQAIKDIISKI